MMKAMIPARRFKTRAAPKLEMIPAAMAGTLEEDTQVAAVTPAGEDTRAAVAIPAAEVILVAVDAAIAAGTPRRTSGWSN